MVRRKIGTIYGFEFISIPPKAQEGDETLCRELLPFGGLQLKL